MWVSEEVLAWLSFAPAPHCRRADDGYRYASISVSLRNKWASSSGSKVVAALALGREKILFVDNFSNKGLWFLRITSLSP
jgi:hypothetical protein